MLSMPWPLEQCRSVLYVPSSKERALAKAAGLDADALIFDLEDAVLPAAKADARQALAHFLRDAVFAHQRIVVRINSISSEAAREDLAMLASLKHVPHAVLIPKVVSLADVDRAADMLGDAIRYLPLWLMIETPQALLHVAELAAYPQVEALVLGLEDLSLALGLPRDVKRAALQPYMAQAVLAAKASHCAVFDGICKDFKQDTRLRDECRMARDMGFTGKSLIHPAQLAPCHEIFSPAQDEINEAQRILTALENAADEKQGVVALDGQMLEPLHGDMAERLLAFHHRIQLRGLTEQRA